MSPRACRVVITLSLHTASGEPKPQKLEQTYLAPCLAYTPMLTRSPTDDRAEQECTDVSQALFDFALALHDWQGLALREAWQRLRALDRAAVMVCYEQHKSALSATAGWRFHLSDCLEVLPINQPARPTRSKKQRANNLAQRLRTLARQEKSQGNGHYGGEQEAA